MKKFNPTAIRILRQAHGLTLEAFAERIGAESKRQIVHQWESGYQVPTVKSLLSISNTFNVPFDIFFIEDNYSGRNDDQIRFSG